MNSEQELIKEVGHEVRKPFIRAMDSTNLLLAGLRGEVPDELQSELSVLKMNLSKALTVTDELLLFVNRIQAELPSVESAQVLNKELALLITNLRALG